MRTVGSCVALALISGSASACEPKFFDSANDAAQAEFLVVGFVTGDRYPNFEKQVLAGEKNPEVSIWHERHVRVAVVERLRGTTQDTIEAPAPCGAPYPGAYARVLVAKGADGFTRVFDARDYEKVAREVLKGGL